MPIYAYRCAACGHAKDVLQKVSDPVLSTCPACGAPTFQKQVTAAGFQLKGSGWYVTDFRGDTKKTGDKPADAPAASEGADKPTGADAKSADAPAAAAAAPAASDGAAAKSTTPAASPAAGSTPVNKT